jgi:hypothetical protein
VEIVVFKLSRLFLHVPRALFFILPRVVSVAPDSFARQQDIFSFSRASRRASLPPVFVVPSRLAPRVILFSFSRVVSWPPVCFRHAHSPLRPASFSPLYATPVKYMVCRSHRPFQLQELLELEDRIGYMNT